MSRRPIWLVSLSLVTIVLASCSTNSPTSSQTPSKATSNSGSSVPAGDANDVFPGDRAVSAATFWEAHPDEAPVELTNATLLLDASGVGQAVYPIEEDSPSFVYIVVLTCDQQQEYRVSLQNEDGAELAWTSGASCGGPALGVFTSPSLTEPATQVVVDVPAETQTALVVYASDSQ